MKHIVMYSGGIGSYCAAKRVIKQHGKQNVILLFTDTLIEDEDLYRFLEETSVFLGSELVKIADGRTPFDIYMQERFLGNARIASCSKILKRRTSYKWLKSNFKNKNEIKIYLGIDWTEQHRFDDGKGSGSKYHFQKKGYEAFAPMCDAPYLTKRDMMKECQDDGIELPRLYKLGFAHNNCGGWCCRAGQGHFINVLKKIPEKFMQFEEFERKFNLKFAKNNSFLKRKINGEFVPVTLNELRREYEENKCKNIDMFDIGGCGCFSL